MTTYNGERFIIELLDSILHQTIKADEVIICDDNSTYNTVKIINNYIKKNKCNNWHIFTNQYTIGYARNFKTAISMCKNEIIFLCDQDDIWKSNKIETLLKCFIENKNINSIITKFDIIDKFRNLIVNENQFNNPWIPKRIKLNNTLTKIDLVDILGHNWSPGCTQAIRKNILNDYLNIKSNMVHDWL